MKKLGYLLSSALLLSILFTIGCKKDGGDETPEYELRLQEMATTWTATDVQLDGDNVTDGFSGFTLTVTNAYGYSASGATRSPQPWPASGTWDFDGAGTDNVNINKVIRDDGLEISIDAISESSLILSFNFVEGTHDSGRTEAVSGNWTFTFAAQ